MKIELHRVEQNNAICEICERLRVGCGAIQVLKSPGPEGFPVLVDFVICDICVLKIGIKAARLAHELGLIAARDPPSEPASSGGGL